MPPLTPEETPKHRIEMRLADGTILPGGYACPCSTVTHETLLERQKRPVIRDASLWHCPSCKATFRRCTRTGSWDRR